MFLLLFPINLIISFINVEKQMEFHMKIVSIYSFLHLIRVKFFLEYLFWDLVDAFRFHDAELDILSWLNCCGRSLTFYWNRLVVRMVRNSSLIMVSLVVNLCLLPMLVVLLAMEWHICELLSIQTVIGDAWSCFFYHMQF